MTLELRSIVANFAQGMKAADSLRPRSKSWQPGLGPHDERELITLVLARMVEASPQFASHRREVPYGVKQKCDVCFGEPIDWAIEIKALRMLGDNGQAAQGRDDVSKLLSPYSKQNSALTDCTKLLAFNDAQRKAMLIYAWDFPDFPMMPMIEAFEVLARRAVDLGPREEASFDGLCHPVHRCGSVFAWEVRVAPRR